MIKAYSFVCIVLLAILCHLNLSSSIQSSNSNNNLQFNTDVDELNLLEEELAGTPDESEEFPGDKTETVHEREDKTSTTNDRKYPWLNKYFPGDRDGQDEEDKNVVSDRAASVLGHHSDSLPSNSQRFKQTHSSHASDDDDFEAQTAKLATQRDSIMSLIKRIQDLKQHMKENGVSSEAMAHADDAINSVASEMGSL